MNADRIAEVYLGTFGGAEQQRRARQRIHWMCAAARGTEILDVGCSQGIASLLLGREGRAVTGVDREEQAIEYARALLLEEEDPVKQRVSFRTAEATALPFEDGSFDSVLIGEILEHQVDPAPILNEARRCLRNEGTLVVTTPYGIFPYHDHKEPIYLGPLLELIGAHFRVSEIELLDSYLAVVGGSPPGRSRAYDPLAALSVAEERLRWQDETVWRQRRVAEERKQNLDQSRERVAALEREVAELQRERTTRESSLRRVIEERDAGLVEAAFQAQRTADLSALRDRLSEALERRTREATSRARMLAEVKGEAQVAKAQAAELSARLEQVDKNRHRLAGELRDQQEQYVRAKAAEAQLKVRVRERETDLELAQRREARTDQLEKQRSGTAEREASAEGPARSSATWAVVRPAPPADIAGSARPTPDRPSLPFDLTDSEMVPKGPVARPGLKVACILDEFSQLAYRYEFQIIAFGQGDWRQTLERETPAFLFVESAWRGNEGRWNYTMSKPEGPKPALVQLVEWCRSHSIPTVFWNKEDPSNFNLFHKSALLFDHIFTVDLNCVARYERLGHRSVGVLPFAAQPRIHNPIRVANHATREVAFAGSYYGQKHPARLAQMEAILKPARPFGLEILSRFEENPKHRFPEGLREHVIGSLPYERMLEAAKLYKVFLNVNSVVDSRTMCARRIFELLGAGVNVVSGSAPAIRALLGPGMVFESQDQASTQRLLKMLLDNPEVRDRQAAVGARTVLGEHTYGKRVDTILERLGSFEKARPAPSVSICCSTNRAHEISNLIENAARQEHTNLELVIVLHGLDLKPELVRQQALAAGVPSATVTEKSRSATLGACMNQAVAAATGDYVTKFDDDNFYGRHYLTDLLQAFRYTDAAVVGKWAHYVYLGASNRLIRRFPQHEHRYVNLVQGGTLTFARSLATEIKFADVPRAVDTTFLRECRARGRKVYATDRFNFVSVRQGSSESHTWRISDDELLEKGIVEVYGRNFDHVVT